MGNPTLAINISISSGKYYLGLGDTECADALGDIYCPDPFMPRNWPDGDSIPEVRKWGNGDNVTLFEELEWLWYNALVFRNPGVPEGELKETWRRHMRGNAAFTNRAGSDTNRSFVLDTNTDKEPMRVEGVDCPRGNLYRASGNLVNKYGVSWIPCWNLDATAPVTYEASDLPAWLVHQAWIIHSNGSASKFDYNFPIVLLTTVGRQEVIDGFPCRENLFRASRLRTK